MQRRSAAVSAPATATTVTITIGAFVVALAAALPAHAQKVHRCVDAKGTVTFSDKRCQTGDALRSPIMANTVATITMGEPRSPAPVTAETPARR